MNCIVHDVSQRSDEWRKLRLGKVTGSNVSDAFATRADKKEAAGRRNLRVRLMLERETGRSAEREVTTRAMEAGIEREPDALARYEIETGKVIRSVGFLSHRDLMAGASPDGIVGDWEGGLEVKCPEPTAHWDHLRAERPPLGYYLQCLHGLWITGVAWWDFVSYCPEYPERLQLRVIRVHRDDKAIEEHERQVRAFLDEVSREHAALRTMADTASVLMATVGAA